MNSSDGCCVAGIVTDDGGYQSSESWLKDGKFFPDRESIWDLVEVKETKDVWMEIYNDARNGKVYFNKYNTKLDALFEIDRNRSDQAYQFIALKRIIYSEGDIDE